MIGPADRRISHRSHQSHPPRIRARLVRRILDDDQYEVLVRGHHNLVLLGADAQKGEIVAGVQVANDAARLVGQLAHQAGILDGGRIVQGALHRDACGARVEGTSQSAGGTKHKMHILRESVGRTRFH